MSTRYGIVIAILILVSPLHARAGLISNGGFEDPAIIGITTYVPGSTELNGWTVGGDGFVFQVNGPRQGLSPSEGLQHVGFHWEGHAPGATTLSQTFATSPGTLYDVTFLVGAVFDSDSAALSLRAEASASSIVLALLDVVPPASPGGVSPYEIHAFRFAAVSTLTTLTFRDTSSNQVGADIYLDNVSVAAVPEPSSLVSAALGLAGLAGYAGWRRARLRRAT